ncbi:MAG: ATP-binding cassette domain-containing protein [Chloroflexia bacterium]
MKDINFNVERGEILGFLGPNGAGKTTTMRIITGYIPATSGTVRVAGFDVNDKSMDARRHLGYLPETVPLYTELTPREYLDFRGRISGMHNTKDRRARVFETMDLLNLNDVQDKLIGSLSRGYRQRVGLAQALLHNPDVLILDEPTVGLDPVQITEVRDLIRELGRERTIILSTHVLPEVSMVCNRVVIINRGRLVAQDTPINLAEDAANRKTVQLEVSGPTSDVLRILRSVSGVTTAVAPEMPANGGEADATSADGLVRTYTVEGQTGVDLRAQIASAVVGAGYDLLELKSVRPSLEQIFIDVISREEEFTDEELDEEDTDLGGESDDPDAPESGRIGPPRSVVRTGEPTQRIATRKRVRR